MLTNDDKKFIEEIIAKSLEAGKAHTDKAIKSAFEDFYDHIFEPFATKNIKEHEEIKEQLVLINEDIKDHRKRIEKLEAVTGV